MFAITHAERFDGVDEDAGYAYRGWNYEVAGASATYRVRAYDDETGRLTVVFPMNARTAPEAQDFVTYLLSSLAGNTVLFYDPSADLYRTVDSFSLEFL